MTAASRTADRRQVAVALVALVVLLAALPWALLQASRRRFGSPNPWAGVAPPWDWDLAGALGDRLTDDALVDLVLRLSITAVWIAIAVLLVTIVAEAAHMSRHGGLSMPHVRGIGWSQPLARAVAAGLLVLLPVVGHARVATGRTAPLPTPLRDAVVLVDPDVRTDLVPAPISGPATRLGAGTTPAAATPAAGMHVVQPGESVYAIAERLAGPDPSAVVRLAERILDLNLGAVMPDGQRFTNAAYIEPGWTLQLPEEAARPAASSPGTHVVRPGDTLSGIAADVLGDPDRWPELWVANAGADMGGGRTFDDPDVIVPGWALRVPTDVTPPVENPSPPPSALAEPDVVPAPAPPDVAPAPAGPAATVPTSTSTTPPSAAAVPAASDAAPPSTTTASAPTSVASSTTEVPTPAPPQGDASDEPATSDAPSPIGLGHAGMLSAGILALLAVRRRQRLRGARPRARVPEPRSGSIATERRLRAVDASERIVRIDVAVRSVALTLAEQGPQVLAALVEANGTIELVLTGPAELPAPWHRPTAGEGDRWQLSGTVPVELVAESGRGAGTPCLALVQLGVDAGGRDVYVDLEALGVLSIDAEPPVADAVAAGIAATLGSSVFAEVATLAGVGIDPVAFVGHRNHAACTTVDEALDLAAAAIGSTAGTGTTTFALRARRTSAESWEPAIVIVGSGHDVPAELLGGVRPGRGLAVVVAGGLADAGATLHPIGGWWRLDPVGLELRPVGLTTEELAAIDDLVVGDDLVSEDDASGHRDADAGVPDGSPGPSEAEAPNASPFCDAEWQLMVRLLGPVDVVDRSGAAVPFERSKTRELVAWLATHRERSTRAGARTAMWELDVRDATFANVVSEARRSMARLVPPPPATEWLGRTLTEELPLHPEVVTDAELVRARLDAARLQPPELAIATLTPAVELVRGLPFEGTAYLWPDAEGITSDLVLLATTVAAELAAHHLSMGDVDGVFAATAAGLRVLAGHEELIALRMRAHAQAGDHAGVRHEWESYERVITADPWSDGEPAPKLVALRRELLTPG